MQIYSKYILSFKKGEAGFNLTELLVVITIATIITTSLIVQQNKWNDHLAVSTQAYEMTLMIRQAQIYSLGVREYVAGTGDKFNIGYGIYFDIATPDRYVFFADKNKNLEKDADEVLETKIFTKGVTVRSICGVNNTGAERCYPQNGVNQVAVSFYRPEPRALIKFFNAPGNENTSVGSPTTFYLQSANGKESSIKVEA